MPARVAVIGAGGMGSWMARYFKSLGKSVVISDREPAKARRVAKRIRVKSATSNLRATRESGIIVVAVPANVTSDVIREIIPALRKNTLLFDLSAIKAPVVQALRLAEKHGADVASLHPMFGPRASGVKGRTIIIVQAGRNRAGTTMVRKLFKGADIVVTDARTHDKRMALCLALPHFINMAFAGILTRGARLARLRKFAGRTFTLQLLLSQVIASEPDTTADIQTMNRSARETLRDLQREIQTLVKTVERGNRSELIARYRRIRTLMSADPQFKVSGKAYEEACKAVLAITRP